MSPAQVGAGNFIIWPAIVCKPGATRRAAHGIHVLIDPWPRVGGTTAVKRACRVSCRRTGDAIGILGLAPAIAGPKAETIAFVVRRTNDAGSCGRIDSCRSLKWVNRSMVAKWAIFRHHNGVAGTVDNQADSPIISLKLRFTGARNGKCLSLYVIHEVVGIDFECAGDAHCRIPQSGDRINICVGYRHIRSLSESAWIRLDAGSAWAFENGHVGLEGGLVCGIVVEKVELECPKSAPLFDERQKISE